MFPPIRWRQGLWVSLLRRRHVLSEEVNEHQQVLCVAVAVGEIEFAGAPRLDVAELDDVERPQQTDRCAGGHQLTDVAYQVTAAQPLGSDEAAQQQPRQGAGTGRRDLGNCRCFGVQRHQLAI